MFGSSLKHIPGSTWLRVTLTTAALSAVAVLSSGCVPFVAAGGIYVIPV